MSADTTKISVYCQGTFSAQNPTPSQEKVMLAAASDLAESGFGTVLLGQWHVHGDGTLYSTTAAQHGVVGDAAIPSALRNGGTGVSNVLLTFGPFAWTSGDRRQSAGLPERHSEHRLDVEWWRQRARLGSRGRLRAV